MLQNYNIEHMNMCQVYYAGIFELKLQIRWYLGCLKFLTTLLLSVFPSWEVYAEGIPHCITAETPLSLPREVRFSFTKKAEFYYTAATR